MAANWIILPYLLELQEFTFWVPGNPYGIKANVEGVVEIKVDFKETG